MPHPRLNRLAALCLALLLLAGLLTLPASANAPTYESTILFTHDTHDHFLPTDDGAGGESGDGARECDFAWVTALRDACAAQGVRFSYHQTGALLRRDGRLYHIPRAAQHDQAKRAGLDII